MEKIIEEIKKLAPGFDGSSIREGVPYHVIPFPELENIPCEKRCCVQEFDLIRSIEPLQGKRVLEIGCANGYFSFNLARAGAKVDAYETDSQAHKINTMLLEHEYGGSNDKPIRFFNKAINTTDLAGTFYDICIMTNVHMWIEKSLGIEATADFMKELSRHCGAIYFQTAHAESEGMHTLDRLKDGGDIVDYLRECGFYHVDAVSSSTEHGGIRYLFRATGLDRVLSESDKTKVSLMLDQSVCKEFLVQDPRLHNVPDAEARALLSLERSKHTPNLMSVTGSTVRMDYVGEPLTSENMPPDFVLQCAEILSDLKATDTRHNDIKPSDLCVKDGSIMLVDFEWATEFNEPMPRAWLENATLIGEGFKDPNGYNDSYSLLSSISSIMGSEG